MAAGEEQSDEQKVVIIVLCSTRSLLSSSHLSQLAVALSARRLDPCSISPCSIAEFVRGLVELDLSRGGGGSEAGAGGTGGSALSTFILSRGVNPPICAKLLSSGIIVKEPLRLTGASGTFLSSLDSSSLSSSCGTSFESTPLASFFDSESARDLVGDIGQASFSASVTVKLIPLAFTLTPS